MLKEQTRVNMENPPKASELPARFSVAARERFAGTFKDQSLLIGAAQLQYDLIDLAAGDFTSGVYIHVTATTAGNAANVTFAGDGPFSALQQVELKDPSGNTFQTYTGYELYLMNMLGGFTGQGDTQLSPAYLATAGVAAGVGGSFGFILRIPAEVFPKDGIGQLWNGSTAAQFKIQVTLAPSTAVYGVAPTNLPNVRLRVNTHGSVLPGNLPSGRAFMDTPPGGQVYVNVNRQPAPIANAGSTIVPLIRKPGSMYRQVIFVFRDSTGARTNTGLGDLRFRIDNVDHYKGTYELLRHVTWERNRQSGLAGNTLPTGVVQVSFCFDQDGMNGGETRDQWVPVQPGSIVELEVAYTAGAAGSVTIIVNDITIMEDAIMDEVVTL